MQSFIEFSLRHWELWLIFFLILGVLVSLELYIRLTGAIALSPQQVVLLLNRENAVILDIRDKAAFLQGHIKGAINLPCTELGDQYQQLKAYQDRPIIINYTLGQPYYRVKRILQKKGFNKFYYLKGGILSWQNANLPLVKQ